MGDSRSHIAATAFTYPDFPWSSIGDAAVEWLRGLVPCPTCQTAEAYLSGLSRASIPNLLKILTDYEVTGRPARPTCSCPHAAQSPTPSVRKPLPLPRATCYLRDEVRWAFDLHNPSLDALAWIKSRWREKHVEDKMRSAWARYVAKPEHHFWFGIGTEFVAWALFPGLFGGMHNEMLLGPGPGLNGDDGALLALRNRPRSKSTGHGPWMAFLNRPPPCSNDKRGPPLSPAVGVMVRDPDFGDADVRQLFACYNKCNVEITASQDWATVGFAPPSGVKGMAFPLRGLHGATLLFLACYVLRDDAACDKLLLMRETGASILKDLTQRQFTGILEGHARAGIAALMADAMQVSTDWSLGALSVRLALWFAAWQTRPAAEHAAPQPLDLFSIVRSLFGLWLSGPPRGTHLFAPDAAEGWEDTAELTAMGVYYGAAVGAAALAALAVIKARMDKMDARERHADAAEEWAHNGVAFITAAFGAGVELGTNATKRALLHRLNRGLVAANADALEHLTDFLHGIQANLRSIAESYAQQMDAGRLYGAFQQAFGCVVAQHFPLPLEAVQTFFNAPTAAVTVPGAIASGTVAFAGAAIAAVPPSLDTQHYTSLRHGAVTHFNAAFGPFIFEDLASLKVHNYSPKYLNTNPRFKRCWDDTAAAKTPHPSAQLLQQCVQLAHLASTPIQPDPPSARMQRDAHEAVQQVRWQRLPAPPAVSVGWRAVASRWAAGLTALACLLVACSLSLQPSWWTQTAPSSAEALFDSGPCSAIGSRCAIQQSWEIGEATHVHAGDTVEVIASPAEGWLTVRTGGDTVAGLLTPLVTAI